MPCQNAKTDYNHHYTTGLLDEVRIGEWQVVSCWSTTSRPQWPPAPPRLGARGLQPWA